MYSNRVTLTGFLGQNAEVKSTRNHNSFTVLSLATKRSWKDRESGEWHSETTWHRCIVWGKLGDFASTLTTGAHVQVEGELRHREYVQNGQSGDAKKSITEVRVISIVRMDRPKKSGADAEGAGAA